MTKNLFSLAASVIALGVASSPALAANRTFVSGVGTDTGTCAITAPCRTFAYALTQTAASGEIIVLTSGGYGSVTITQAVSIINASNFAGVTVATGNGITINALATDTVVLRGISIDGGGTGANGIVFNSGGSLMIDQCNMQNFVGSATAGNGILMQPGFGNHNVVITNTAVSNNTAAGVVYFPQSSTATTGIVIDRVSANNNGDGILIQGSDSSGTTTASISNSIASFNGGDGFYLSKVTASLDASSASNNGNDGVFAGGGSTLALGRSVFMNNTQYGVFNNATINSYKDNRIAGNGSGQITSALGTGILY